MKPDAISGIYLACEESARDPYRRLGLRFDPAGDLRIGATRVAFRSEATPGPMGAARTAARAAGRALFAVGLRVPDVAAAVAALSAHGVPAERDGTDAWVPIANRAATDLVLTGPTDATPAPAHAIPLRRLDHLAAIAHDLEAVTHFWAEVLGVKPAGEVTTPAMVIRQLRVGDAVLELLGPTGADSPVWKRPAGLVSMASWEVADVEAAVTHARSANFSASEPATGPLPGTRIATVAGVELAGVNLQLLQYVGQP